MAISDRLNKLTTDITNAYTSIENKGGTIPANKNTNNLPTAINSIEVIETATAEGESLNLVNTKAMPYSDYIVEGKSEQDGEPSPSIPSEIHSVADDVNLFDINSTVGGNGSFTKTIENNHLTLTASGTLGAQYVSNYVKNVDSSKKYTLSFKAKKTVEGTDGVPVIQIIVYGSNDDTNYTLLGLSKQNPVEGQEYSLNYTVTGYNYYRFFIYNNAGTPVTVGEKTEYWDIKFQEGSVATPYSPYNYGTFTIDFEGQTENYNYTFITEPLRSLPNGVKDTIEAEQHRKIEYLVFDGSDDEGWGSYTLLSNNIVQVGKPLSKTAKSRVGLSNRFSVIADYSSTEHIVIAGGFTAVYIHIDQTRFNTQDLAGFKEWLSNNPVTLQYELEEEIIEPLTQNQATTMLDIIKTGSYEGTTNIYTDEDVKPIIGVRYYKKA